MYCSILHRPLIIFIFVIHKKKAKKYDIRVKQVLKLDFVLGVYIVIIRTWKPSKHEGKKK